MPRIEDLKEKRRKNGLEEGDPVCNTLWSWPTTMMVRSRRTEFQHAVMTPAFKRDIEIGYCIRS
jgi:hypothetical protein